MDGDDERMKVAKKWIEDLSEGRLGYEIENLILPGLHIIHAHTGFFLCNFVVPQHLTDKNGNWHVGAMTTLIDNVGAAAIASSVGLFKASVDFDVSYFSTVRFNEEVEIEARFLGHKGKLASVIVTIRRKENGEIVALGKQWMITQSSSVNNKPSKL